MFRTVDLEALAKLDVEHCNRKSIVKRLQETIKVSLEAGRPEKAEWCEVLLKKFTLPTKPTT